MKHFIAFLFCLASTTSSLWADDAKVKLDSIVCTDNIKIEYLYNSEYKQTDSYISSWENQQWTDDTHNQMTYNEQGQLICVKGYEFYQGQWSFVRQSEYTYDEQGRMVQGLMYGYSGNPDGSLCGKEEFAYNEQNQMTESVFYERYSDEWHPSTKTSYTYDDLGNVATEISYYWEDNAWQTWDRNDYTYDNSVTTVDGKKKVLTCINTDDGETVEYHFYYSQVGISALPALSLQSQHPRTRFNLFGQRTAAPSSLPTIIDGKITLTF